MKEIKLLESPLYGISAAGDYSELLHEREGIHSTYLIKISIRQWSAEFYHKMYCRIHRSHLVNVDRVIAFEADADGHGGYAVLNNGRRFKVSRGYVEAFHCATDYRFASAVQKRNRRRKRGGGAEKAKTLTANISS
jgi:hypothetical protein